MIRILCAAATAAILAGTAVHPTGAQQGDFHWSGRLAQGEQIQIDNVIGDIRAEPTDGGEVTVTGVRSGEDAGSVRIEVVRRREGTVICAIYSDDGRHRDDDDYDGRDDGQPRDACNQRHVHVHDSHAAVAFTVRVPAGVRLAAHTVSGSVDVRGLRGPVDAKSVSGNVHVSATGPVQAMTVSGNVVAELGRTAGRDLEFRSVSGDVTLQVPAGIDAEFDARTLSGSIDSDFPLQRGRGDDHGGFNIRVGQEAHGTLGRGGPSLRVTTVSGDVTLRRAR
jgi:hypothetical protein